MYSTCTPSSFSHAQVLVPRQIQAAFKRRGVTASFRLNLGQRNDLIYVGTSTQRKVAATNNVDINIDALFQVAPRTILQLHIPMKKSRI